MRNVSLHLILMLLLVATSGCTSLLYFPTDYMYLDPAKINASPQEHELTLSSGDKVYGWYFKAQQQPARGVVLLFHGNGQNRSAHYLSLYWLTEKGYDLAVFDYPGDGN